MDLRTQKYQFIDIQRKFGIYILWDWRTKVRGGGVYHLNTMLYHRTLDLSCFFNHIFFLNHQFKIPPWNFEFLCYYKGKNIFLTSTFQMTFIENQARWPDSFLFYWNVHILKSLHVHAQFHYLLNTWNMKRIHHKKTIVKKKIEPLPMPLSTMLLVFLRALLNTLNKSIVLHHKEISKIKN